MVRSLHTVVVPLAGIEGAHPSLSTLGERTLFAEVMDEVAAAGAARLVLVLPPGQDAPDGCPPGIDLRIVRQEGRPGLGDAVMRAEPQVGEGPVGVLLPDDLILGGTCLAEMAEAYWRAGTGHMVASCEVAWVATPLYGILDPLTCVGLGTLFRTVGIVEKPAPEEAPSRIAVAGRYLLHPQVFRDLAARRPAPGTELDLTCAISDGISRVGLSGFTIKGRRLDCSQPSGMLAARAALASATASQAAQ